MKLCVLGGSSPFTAALFEAASRTGDLRRFESIVLHGRNRESLESLAAHGRLRCGTVRTSVVFELDVARALKGSDVVLVQVRVGGTALRLKVDGICAEAGVFADETLGLGGLATALASRDGWDRIAEDIARWAPRALVVNLMNPLSLSSTRLTRAGLDVVGLCEGPLCTAQDVAALLGVPAHEMAWAYTGLNHRGIVHTFAHGDRPIVLDARGRGAPLRHGAAYMPSMNGFLSKEVLQVQAPDSWRYGRAKQVADIRARLMSELLTGEGVDPGSLALRPTPWYCQAVLPFLGAWTGFAAPWQTTVNVELGELFVETRAVVSERDLHTWRNAAPTPDAERFLHGIERHERASIEALYRGDPDAARHALSQDPFIAPDAVDAAWQRLHQLPVFPEFTRT